MGYTVTGQQTFYIDKTLKKEFTILCAEIGISKSKLLCFLIKTALDKKDLINKPVRKTKDN
jgi:antitoxin component of RelBE/YafQ-DinJ toxin-antitoxin module